MAAMLDLYHNNSLINEVLYFLFLAQEGHLECLEWLAKRTATVHSEASIDGMTAAHAAAQEGHIDCLTYLIQYAGCSGLARDKSGCTPMHFGKRNTHIRKTRWRYIYIPCYSRSSFELYCSLFSKTIFN